MLLKNIPLQLKLLKPSFPRSSSISTCYFLLKKKYSTSSSITVKDPIKQPKIRWFYATDIPLTKPHHPEYKLLKGPTKFLPFTRDDSAKIEEKFHKFNYTDKKNANSKNRFVNVNEDGLFNVDLLKKTITPTYWLGPTYEVRRGIWFNDANQPLPDLLTQQIEDKYAKYRPDYFLKKSKKNENYKLPADLLKSEREAYEVKSNELASPKKWPYKEFDDFTDVPKVLHFKSDTEALLVNKGQLLPHFLLDNFGGYSNSILGVYAIRRGYTKHETDEEQNKQGKTAGDIETGTSPKLSKLQEIESEEYAKDATEKNIKEIKTSDDNDNNELGNFFVETNKKLQSFMETDFSNETISPENSQDRDVDHLILCVHGIGQSLSAKYTTVNFAHDCNHLRQLVKSEFVKKSNKFVPLAYDNEKLNEDDPRLKNCKVQILPIIWRYDIDFGLDYLYNEFINDGSYRLPKLADLNVEAVTPLRNLTADVLLDVLLFYEPSFKKQILASVTKQANELYDKYLENHPNFKGKVSLIGHSLGSAIFMDILSGQPDKIPTGKDFNPKEHLKFGVENFFTLGSPNGVFKFLRRENVYPRKLKDKLRSDTPAIYPRVKNLYNIFYATDLVAYRLEPLIHTDLRKVKPKQIKPIYEDNIFTSKIKDFSKTQPEILGNKVFKTILENTSTWQELSNEVIDNSFNGKETKLELSDFTKDVLFELNTKHGRIDYVLPQGMFDIDIINAVGSHIQYFDDSDVADLLLNELWRKPKLEREVFGVVKEKKAEREQEKPAAEK